MLFINLINVSLIMWNSSLRNEIILWRRYVLWSGRMNHGKLRSFAHLNTLGFYFGHCVLHWVIATMIDVENVSILLNHSIIIVEIRLFRPTISHVVMILGFRENLFIVLLSSVNNVCSRSGLWSERCRTIDMILHFLLIIELLLDNHSFMVLYLRRRIGMR